MSPAVRQLLETFDALPEAEQRQAVDEILRRATAGKQGDLPARPRYVPPAGAVWINRDDPAFLEKYNLCWVAATAEGIVAADRSMAVVCAELDRLGIPNSDACLAWVTKEIIQ